MIILVTGGVMAVLGPLGVMMWMVTTRHDKRHVTFAEIRWRADYENQLTAHGHPAGIHGRYRPYV
jgi:hypothetical protein